MLPYKSKVVVIHAEQFDGNSTHPEIRVGEEGCFVTTLEGPLTIRPGDWLIQGTEGEFYPCKDSVFRRKYEACE